MIVLSAKSWSCINELYLIFLPFIILNTIPFFNLRSEFQSDSVRSFQIFHLVWSTCNPQCLIIFCIVEHNQTRNILLIFSSLFDYFSIWESIGLLLSHTDFPVEIRFEWAEERHARFSYKIKDEKASKADFG